MKLSTKILAVAFVVALALTVTTVASAASFENNLTVGSTGADVTALQTTLVGGGFLTMPAGVNMGYFGALTQAAVAKYQVAKGITPAAGFVGPITRAALNAGGAVAGALCPNGMTLASNCTQAPGVVVSVPLCPNGMTLASNCSAAPGTTVTSNVEGSFTVTLAANPSAQTGITATQNVPIIGFNIKALDSDITIDRLDLQTGVTYTSGTLVPGSFINNVSVMDGSTVLLSRNVTNADFEKTSSGVYYIRLSGLNFKVAKDTTKALTVAMSVNSITGSDAAKTITVLGYGTNGVRGTDSAGFNQYADATGLTRAQAFAVSGLSTLAATADVNLVDSANIKVHLTDGAKDVPMMSFNVKSTTGASVITDVRLDVVAAADALPSTIYLYDGSTLLGSMTAVASTTFEDLAIAVAKDQTKTLTVKADFAGATGSGVDAADTAIVSLRANGITFDRPDGSSSAVSNASKIDGNTMYEYPGSIAQLTLVSATSVYTAATDWASSTLKGTLIMDVKADGAQVTLPTASNFTLYFASSTVPATAASTGAAATVKNLTVSPSQAITDGAVARLTLDATATKATNVSGYLNLVLTQAVMVTADNTITQTWGLDDFHTPAMNLY
jgi:hypothetical protein